jgi:hypothetical protein
MHTILFENPAQAEAALDRLLKETEETGDGSLSPQA